MTHEIVDAVHDALKKECADEKAVLNEIGALGIKYGDAAMKAAIMECARIAYLRLRFSEKR